MFDSAAMNGTDNVLRPLFGATRALENSRRVELLKTLGILDTVPEPSFDGLTAAAALVTGCPTALVSLLDESRQWFKSAQGLLAAETPIEDSFCAHTALQDALFEVEDTWEDPRFARNPLVIGAPHMRFYAGVPLTVDGVRIGALCVIDTQPGRLSSEARRALVGLACAASALIAARRSEMDLRTHQNRLADIALASGDWLWETNSAHQVQWCASHDPAERASALFREASWLPDGPLVDSRGTPVQPLNTLRSSLRERLPVTRATVCTIVDGQPVYLSFSARPCFDRGGAFFGFRGTARDVSATVEQERQRHEDDFSLRLERDGAQRSAKLRSELVSRVSHELRTPLNAVLGFSQLLTRGATDSIFCATQIHRAATHLLGLVNDMLDLARLESGRERVELRTVATDAVLKRCVDLMLAECQARGVQMSWATDPNAEAVRADLRGLTQVLLNLLSNALKFSPPGSLVQVRATAAEDGRVRIHVIDQGPGIASESLSSLFQPFSQLTSSAKRSGTGLGLSISRQLVESMGGELSVQSNVGKGSSFTVTLDPGERDELPLPETDFSLLAAPTRGSAARRPMNVLYIEDDPVNALVLDRMIAHLGDVKLHHAETAAEGCALAASLELDLVLLDMNLPDGHGIDVFPALLSAFGVRSVPVVALSADALPEAIFSARQAGFDDYLTKPVDLVALERLLGKFRDGTGVQS